MSRVKWGMIAVCVVALSSTSAYAQQTGNFVDDPLVVELIDPGPGYSFTYAYVNVDMENLNPTGDVYTLDFINTYGLDLDVYVTEVTPYWGPWKEWPFAPVGSTTEVSVEILIMNYTGSNAVFHLELLDKNDNELDGAAVYAVEP